LQAALSAESWQVIREMFHPKPHFSDRKRIDLLVFPPVREIDVVGPLDAFSTANRLSGKRPLYEVTVTRTGSKPEIAGMSGLSLLFRRKEHLRRLAQLPCVVVKCLMPKE
jgi:transcriptional regulator GlxA family with amidase domain